MPKQPAPSPTRPPAERPADFEGVICAEEIRAKRLVICDDAGRARIVTELRRGTTEVRITLDADDGRRPTMVLFAGDDPRFGPTLGVHLVVGGEELVALSVWQDGTEPWRATLSGVQPGAGTSE